MSEKPTQNRLANAVGSGSESADGGQSDQSGYDAAAEKGLNDVADKTR